MTKTKITVKTLLAMVGITCLLVGFVANKFVEPEAVKATTTASGFEEFEEEIQSCPMPSVVNQTFNFAPLGDFETSLRNILMEERRMGSTIYEIFQKIFPQGLIIGNKDVGQSGVQQIIVDSSNNLYIGSSTDATFKIAADGQITLRNINLVTSTLNWSGDVSFGTDDLYVDISEDAVGMGTTTPSYVLEIVSSPKPAVVAITASSTDDAVLRFNNGYQAQEWVIFMDNSDGDKLKIATSTDIDILTIDENGALTLTGALTQSGGVVSIATTTIVGPLVVGGDVTTLDWDNVTTTAAQICDSSILRHPANSTTTLGLPTATSTIADCITEIGSCWTVRYQNISTSTEPYHAAVTIKVTDAYSGGTILLEPSGGDVVIQTNEWAWLEFCNLTGVTTTVSVTSHQNSD